MVMGLDVNLSDVESERRVLSAMLHSEEACVEACHSLSATDFANPLHATVFELNTALYEQGIHPTYVELLKEAQNLGFLRNTAAVEELEYISSHYIEEENIQYWVQRVRDQSRLRKYRDFLLHGIDQLQQPGERDAEQILLEAENQLTNLTALEFDDHIDTPAELAKLGYEEVERRFRRFRELQEHYKGVVPLDGLPTGFDNLDRITLGYKPGDLVILGAQTGHGKTSFALHTAKQIAIKSPYKMLYLNTEMSREQIALRWGSILTGIEHDKVRSGELTETELSRLTQAYAELRGSKFYSYPCPNLTPEKTISIARKFKTQEKIDIMVVDYVGRMDKQDPRYQEWQVLEQIVKTQKLLAQNLNMVVMCLVQLNPDGSLQGAKRMKNECDLMLKLSPIPRDVLEESEELKKYDRPPNYWIYIDKNRDGQSGVSIPIYFDLQKQTMQDVKRVSI